MSVSFLCNDCTLESGLSSEHVFKPVHRYHMWLRHLASDEHQNIVNGKWGIRDFRKSRKFLEDDRYVMVNLRKNKIDQGYLNRLAVWIGEFGVVTELTYGAEGVCVFSLQAAGNGKFGKCIDRALSILQETELWGWPIKIFKKDAMTQDDWNRIEKGQVYRELFKLRNMTNPVLKDNNTLEKPKEGKKLKGKQKNDFHARTNEPVATGAMFGPFHSKRSPHYNENVNRKDKPVFSNRQQNQVTKATEVVIELPVKESETRNETDHDQENAKEVNSKEPVGVPLETIRSSKSANASDSPTEVAIATEIIVEREIPKKEDQASSISEKEEQASSISEKEAGSPLQIDEYTLNNDLDILKKEEEEDEPLIPPMAIKEEVHDFTTCKKVENVQTSPPVAVTVQTKISTTGSEVSGGEAQTATSDYQEQSADNFAMNVKSGSDLNESSKKQLSEKPSIFPKTGLDVPDFSLQSATAESIPECVISREITLKCKVPDGHEQALNNGMEERKNSSSNNGYNMKNMSSGEPMAPIVLPSKELEAVPEVDSGSMCANPGPPECLISTSKNDVTITGHGISNDQDKVSNDGVLEGGNQIGLELEEPDYMKFSMYWYRFKDQF